MTFSTNLLIILKLDDERQTVIYGLRFFLKLHKVEEIFRDFDLT